MSKKDRLDRTTKSAPISDLDSNTSPKLLSNHSHHNTITHRLAKSNIDDDAEISTLESIQNSNQNSLKAPLPNSNQKLNGISNKNASGISTPQLSDDDSISFFKLDEKAELAIVNENKPHYLLTNDPKIERSKDHDDILKRIKYLLNLTDLFREFIESRLSKDRELKKILTQLDLENEANNNKVNKNIKNTKNIKSKKLKKNQKSNLRSSRRSKRINNLNNLPNDSNSTTSSNRRRKTEKEEDAELIHDEEDIESLSTSSPLITQSPYYINHGKLRDYQIQGLNWLISLYENSISGILADEMGLGKTLQTISFLGYLRYYKRISGPFIIIVPKSTLDNWRREFSKWTSNVNVLVLQGLKNDRADLIQQKLLTCDFDVCITSFETVIKEKSHLKKFAWKYIIVDEAHRIKNESSALSQIIRLFYSKNRLLITGTPLQNNLHELWALLNFLLPDIFSDSEIFDQWFEKDNNNNQKLINSNSNPNSNDNDNDNNNNESKTSLENKTTRKLRSSKRNQLNTIHHKENNIESSATNTNAVTSTPNKTTTDPNLDRLDEDLMVEKLHKILSPFLLRRVKADVEKSLLPKKEINVYVGMSEMQIKWYKKLLEKDIDAVNGVIGKREGKTRLLNIVMQLRKCCNHPYLFEGAEPGPPYTTDEHLIFNSGKMIILDKLLKRLKEQGSRVLIFSQMSRLLDILEDYCYFREFEYCRIDGSTPHEDRIFAIDEFNKPDSDKFIFLLTTRAGGLGINLTSADIVILYDSDWNPQADLQAMDRAHRIGQKKQVKVFRFVTENAIEEKVIERAAQKLRLDQLVIQQGRSNKNNSKLGDTKDDLLTMIQHGAQKVFESKDSTIGDDDIDTILKKGEQKTKTLNKKFENLGLDDLQKFTSDSSAYEWNGTNFAKKGNDKGFSVWINPSKRERKEQTYSIDNYYKDVLQSTKVSNSIKAPKAPKNFHIQDHQFYSSEFKTILEKEMYYYKKQINYKVLSADIPDIDQNDKSEEHESKDKRKKREQLKINKAEPLTKEEEELKQKYIDEAFGNWTRRDFTNFVHAVAKYGRNSFDLIVREMGNKTKEEIISYSKAFWKGYKEIEGHEKYILQIEAGEKKSKRLMNQQRLLLSKVSQYRAPIQEMVIQYPPNNSKRIYSELEDKFLLIMVNKLGLFCENLFEKIKELISKCELFKFDWFFLSRTPQELSRRCNTLLLALTREYEGPNALRRKREKKPTLVLSQQTESRQVSEQPVGNESNGNVYDGESLAPPKKKQKQL
ncbi:DNA translocase ASCRUDRAFT_73329 [Ascoidea rubescens DSM 1968]|uniref:Helicase SWR1 n=1 Tax=Ascoidea rubescens DSM 1968 TaxID=1344418 RepID=A0A1D2VPD7_9ASCO|nr:hypothetical protein ASCRUDRAFT_73329 [Ascoidea rubescens DSM 1968]ODV63482.1 hypothetical protein ASCRUDRAFT_73329 [Ascoidea rubescens DSM 1968]